MNIQVLKNNIFLELSLSDNNFTTAIIYDLYLNNKRYLANFLFKTRDKNVQTENQNHKIQTNNYLTPDLTMVFIIN